MTASKAFLPQQALLQVHPACLAVLERTFSWWCVPTASTRRKQRQHIAESRSASLPGGGGGGATVLVNSAGCVGQPVHSQDKPVQGRTC